MLNTLQFGAQNTNTDPIAIILNLMFFLLIFVSMFYGQKIQSWKAAKEIEAGLVKLKEWDEECKQVLLNNFKKVADPKIVEKDLMIKLEEFMTFVAIPPVMLDPYGAIKKFDHVINVRDERFREEVDEDDLIGRLVKWLQSIDVMKDDLLDRFLGNGSNAMSADRWEWQLLRLSLAWGIELASKRNKSGPSFENYDEISNDIFDIYYVSHLSQADGLIASDKRLVQPLVV